jgi:primosomal protein N'
MKSTTRLTSRKTARIITPATWPWCAHTLPKIPVVLSSATPSVETEVNARRGRYRRVALPSRFGGQHMPHIEAIDLRAKGRSAAASFRRA